MQNLEYVNGKIYMLLSAFMLLFYGEIHLSLLEGMPLHIITKKSCK